MANTNKKSKLQEILDMEPTTAANWGLQQLVINCSKTELATMARVLRRLDKVLYKSTAKALTLSEIKMIVDDAAKTIHDNKMED